MIALGDSHTRAYGRNPHFTPIFLEPGKVNNFVDWANVDSMLDKCHRIEAALSPKEVIFCLGEPDTRYALGLGWNPWSSDRLPDESNHIFLDKCAERYLDFYKELVTAFGWTIYVQNVALTQSPSQCRYIEYYNQILANQLGERFIEFNSRIKTESGTIHPEYAWDLLIFDADGFHRGGVVYEGGERRVLRAHTYPTGRRYSDKPFSSGWWASSPLNINRWFKSSTTRVLGDRIQEATTNRYQHDISKKKPLDD